MGILGVFRNLQNDPDRGNLGINCAGPRNGGPAAEMAIDPF